MAKSRRKARSKPYTPPTSWDHGTGTPAALHLTVAEERGEVCVETCKIKNPNGIKGRRRCDWVEWYARQGRLSERQLAAALKLRCAFEQTQRSPPAIQAVRVDTSPKPDHAVAIQMDRADKFHGVMRHVLPMHRTLIDHVVVQNRPISSLIGPKGQRGGRQTDKFMMRLADGLETLADALGC